jgi:hypothetical protein
VFPLAGKGGLSKTILTVRPQQSQLLESAFFTSWGVGDEAVDLRITTKCDGEAGEGV